MLALLQLRLPEVAAQQGVAVLIHPLGEVLAGDADAAAFPSLQVSIVRKIPLLYDSPWQYACTASGHSDLATVRLTWAVITTGPRKLQTAA